MCIIIYDHLSSSSNSQSLVLRSLEKWLENLFEFSRVCLLCRASRWLVGHPATWIDIIYGLSPFIYLFCSYFISQFVEANRVFGKCVIYHPNNKTHVKQIIISKLRIENGTRWKLKHQRHRFSTHYHLSIRLTKWTLLSIYTEYIYVYVYVYSECMSVSMRHINALQVVRQLCCETPSNPSSVNGLRCTISCHRLMIPFVPTKNSTIKNK